MKSITLFFSLFFFYALTAEAGFIEEYKDLKKTYQENLRKYSEAQNKIEELNTTWNHFWHEDWVDRKLRQQLNILRDINDDQKRIKDRIKHLENYQMVRVWSKANGNLSSKLSKLSEYLNCDCNMVEYGEDLYKDWATVQTLALEKQSIAIAANYVGTRDPYISKCVAKPNTWTVDVNTSSRDLCKKPDKYHGTSVRYKLINNGTSITLKMNINLSYLGEAKNKEESQKRISKARACVEEFYSRYGINMELSFDINSSQDYEHHHNNIYLYDTYPRADSSHWATHHTVGKDLSESAECALIVHELGHSLGLPDTYADPDCPDRALVLPYPNVMSNSHYHPDDLEFNESQIKAILGPLCGP